MSPIRLAAMAAVFAIALVGAAWVGRATAPNGGAGGPVPTANPSPTVLVSIGTYRIARDAICERYLAELDPLKAQIDRITDPTLPEAERTTKIQAFGQLADRYGALDQELRNLAVPPELAAEDAAQLARFADGLAVIRQEIARLQAGDLSGAQQLDEATTPMSDAIQAFERKYGLAGCP